MWPRAVLLYPSTFVALIPSLCSISSRRNRLPEPFSRFTNLTFFLDRSAIDLIPLGFPFATTSPCSHRAKVMTLYPPSGKRFFTVDRLGSSVLGSQRCEPAICTLPSTSQLMACMLEQLAAI